MIRRPPRSTLSSSSAASDVYKRQVSTQSTGSSGRGDMADNYSDDELEKEEEMWDEHSTYVHTATNDRAWVIQKSANDDENIPKDKLPAQPNFVGGNGDKDQPHATVLRHKNIYKDGEPVGIDFVEEPCLMENLVPGMIIKVKAEETVPADIIPIANGNQAGHHDPLFADTSGYDSVAKWSSVQPLMENHVFKDDQEFKNFRFYVRAQASTRALDHFKGAITYCQETEESLVETQHRVYVNEAVGGDLDELPSLNGELDRNELSLDERNFLGYRMVLKATDPETCVYGICVYTCLLYTSPSPRDS
eukprot:TRINITY_DN90_c0_g1_i2.p1 TRINITY_DN90_c0_g1~~TRINITY_DN90_c0_g1_i2.p1  ORF type:complete len:305 (-),score=72.26 TRINITY_DN90_c0_g1_i2:170-1084(-)